jgi:hypothetical protein
MQYNKIHVLIITFFSYMFRGLLRNLQGQLFCTLKVLSHFVITLGLQLFFTVT